MKEKHARKGETFRLQRQENLILQDTWESHKARVEEADGNDKRHIRLSLISE